MLNNPAGGLRKCVPGLAKHHPLAHQGMREQTAVVLSIAGRVVSMIARTGLGGEGGLSAWAPTANQWQFT